MPGNTVPLVPKNRFSVTGNVHPMEGLTLSLIGLYVGSQYYLNDETNTEPQLSSYFLLNGRLAYERPVPGGRLAGFLMLNNILNQKYSTSGTIASNTLTGGGAHWSNLSYLRQRLRSMVDSAIVSKDYENGSFRLSDRGGGTSAHHESLYQNR